MKSPKIVWNVALAAYDRDLDVLESTRHDYGEFLRQTLQEVEALVGKRLGGSILVEKWEDDAGVGPHPYILDWKFPGPRGVAGLGVQAMPSIACGGAPGTFLVLLWLDTEGAIASELDLDPLEASCRQACLDLSGGPYDPQKHPKENDEAKTLRVAAVDLGVADLPGQIASHVVTYLDAAGRLADAAAEPNSPDPFRWSRLRLLEIRASFSLPTAARSGKLEWESGEGLGDWEGGRYLGIKRRGAAKGEDDELWVCALPGDDVVFAGCGPFTKVAKSWNDLCAYGKKRSFNDGPGATLFDAAAIRKMAEKGRVGEFNDKVMAVFKTFLEP